MFRGFVDYSVGDPLFFGIYSLCVRAYAPVRVYRALYLYISVRITCAIEIDRAKKKNRAPVRLYNWVTCGHVSSCGRETLLVRTYVST